VFSVFNNVNACRSLIREYMCRIVTYQYGKSQFDLPYCPTHDV
jgi:hypothetical protein